jgi:hypothetical protein
VSFFFVEGIPRFLMGKPRSSAIFSCKASKPDDGWHIPHQISGHSFFPGGKSSGNIGMLLLGNDGTRMELVVGSVSKKSYLLSSLVMKEPN